MGGEVDAGLVEEGVFGGGCGGQEKGVCGVRADERRKRGVVG